MRRGTASGASITVIPPGGSSSAGLALSWTREAPPGAVDLELSIDAAGYIAWANASRYCTARVLIDGEDVSDLLVGEIGIASELDNVVSTAEFSLLTPRGAYYHPTSLANRPAEVTIDFAAGPSPAGLVWSRVFEGYVDGASNTGADLIRVTFQCVSASAAWAETEICSRGFAYSGKTRGQILREALDQFSIPYANPAAELDALWSVQVKPWDFQGLTIDGLLEQIQKVERFRYRVTPDNRLEILPEDRILLGTPVLDLTDGSSDGTVAIAIEPEEGPRNPRRMGVLSGSALVEEQTDPNAVTQEVNEALGFDADGNPYKVISTVTRQGGVETRRVEEELAVFQADGATLGPAQLQVRKRTEVDSDYEPQSMPNGETRLTTKLRNRYTTVYEMTGVLVSHDAPLGTVWTDGNRYLGLTAELLPTQEIIEHFEWDFTSCQLKAQTVTEWARYAPLADPAAPGSTTHLYADGTWRTGYSYAWQVVKERSITWRDYRATFRPSVQFLETQKFYRQVGFAAAPYEEQPIEAYRQAGTLTRVWQGNEANTEHDVVEVESYPAGQLQLSTTKTTHAEGPVPGPPTASSAVAQIAQQTIVVPFDFTGGSPYSRRPHVEDIPLAQSVAELDRAAVIIVSRDLCTKTSAVFPALPGYGVGDVTRLTDLARSILLKPTFACSLSQSMVLTGQDAGRFRATVSLEVPA